MKNDKADIINQSLEIIKKYSDDQEYRDFLTKLLINNKNGKDTLPPEVLEELMYLQEKENTLLKKKN
ncbi:MAG: hypothetical protein II625_00365 [Bacilli bacterium]|nr:hypothetical protein [Bacilli bacterium]